MDKAEDALIDSQITVIERLEALVADVRAGRARVSDWCVLVDAFHSFRVQTVKHD